MIFPRKGSGVADILIISFKEGNDNFEFIDDGDLTRYLGVDIAKYMGGLKSLNLI